MLLKGSATIHFRFGNAQLALFEQRWDFLPVHAIVSVSDGKTTFDSSEETFRQVCWLTLATCSTIRPLLFFLGLLGIKDSTSKATSSISPAIFNSPPLIMPDEGNDFALYDKYRDKKWFSSAKAVKFQISSSRVASLGKRRLKKWKRQTGRATHELSSLSDWSIDWLEKKPL